MAVFPFTEMMFNPFSRHNPFIALVPGMEPLHKVTETLIEDAIETSAASGDGFTSMTDDYNALGANVETIMRSLPGFDRWPELPGLPDGTSHPMGAMVAGSAVAMGMASQMIGIMAGSMAGLMNSAVRFGHLDKTGPLPSASRFAPDPVKFEWAFAAGSPQTSGPAKNTGQDAATDAAQVIDLAAEKVPAKPAGTSGQAASPKVTAAKAAAAGLAKAPATPRMAKKPKPAATTGAAAIPAASNTGAKSVAPQKTPAARPVALKKVADAPALDDVPVRPGAGSAKADMDAKGSASAAKGSTSAAKAVEGSARADKAAKGSAKADLAGDLRQPQRMKKPARPDDLKQISGVGPRLEGVLNNLGIWHFDQIAKLSPGEVAWLDDDLRFKGRIERDDWIGQAAALAPKAG